MRKGMYITARLIGLLIVLILAAMLAVQHPRVQSELAKKAIEKLEDKFDGKITYSSLRILPFNALILKDVLVMDDHPMTSPDQPGWAPADTFFYARTLSATLTLKGLAEKEGLHFKRVAIDDALFHMVIEPDSIYTCNLSRIFNLPKKTERKQEPGGNIFDIKKVKLSNFNYRMTNYKMPQTYNPHNGINYGDMDLVADILGHDLKFSGNRMYGVCDAMSCREKSGYEIKNITGSCAVGMGKAMINDIHLVDRWSDLKAKYYSMTYVNGWTYAPYTENILMEIDFLPGTLAMQTISSFTGALEGNNIVWDIAKGHAKGYVNDFSVDGFEFKDMTTKVSGRADASCLGITTSMPLSMKYKISGFNFTPESLSDFISCWAPGTNLALEKSLPNKPFRLDANGSGTLDKMDVKALISSRYGSADANIDLRNLASPERGIEIGGTIDTHDLDISAFTGIEQLGACTLQTGLRAKFEGKSTSLNVDSLKVSRLQALGYDYTGISAKGQFSNNKFDGRVVCNDPNLNFMFQGVFNLSRRTNNALYKFYANLGYADLKALNLDTRGNTSKASCQVSANFIKVKRGDVLGDINVRNLYLENDEGPHDIGDISIGSHANNEVNRIQLSSSFADGGYVGTKAIGSLLTDIQALTTKRHLPALYSDPSAREKAGRYDLSLNLHDTRDILSFALPGAYIADSTSIAMTMDGDGALKADLKSSRIAYGLNYLKNLELTADNAENSLNCIATADEISVGGIGFRNSALTAYGQDNGFSAAFHYDGLSGLDNLGEIYLNGEFLRDESDSLVIKARPLSSYICFEDEQWDISESEVTISKEGLSVDRFALACDDQMLVIDGGISKNSSDELEVRMDNFDLGIIGRFLKKDLGIKGKTSGITTITSPIKGYPGIMSDLNCDALSIGGETMGSVSLAGKWDEEKNNYVLNLDNFKDGRDALALSGNFDPSSRRLNAKAKLDRFEIAPAEAFLPNVFSKMGGSIDGNIDVSGPLDTLMISGTGLSLDDVLLKVAFTGVEYIVSGPFHMDNKGLYSDGITVRDRANGKANVTGAIRYDRLKDIELDLGVKLSKLQALAMSKEENKGVYGDLAVSGQATVTGPFSGIMVDTDILTDGEGKVFVPIGASSALADGASDLLTFVEKEKYIDPYEQMMQTYSEKKETSSGFSAKARVGVSPAVQAIVEMDSTTGNEITASGTGNVSLELNTARDIFTLNGSYNIDNGSYRFELPGVVKKDFTIANGSSIKFGGAIMDSELNINAIHQLKTSLSTLTADTTSVSTRRLVECGISITDKIRNPHLAFSVQVPDLDPTMQAQVQSALNTEDKVQKQFISLLLFNTFLPNEMSGIANGNNLVFSNVSEIMTGQLNNILQKLEIPLDLGFNYQQNDGGTDIFDVAFSSQLFNNRVVVNGSVGNRKNSTSTSENGDIVGDIDIEYKIDNQGQFRVKLFSHSADEYSSYLDLSQRNGIGLTYQKEYNKFTEFVKSIFSSREKREQKALEAALAPEENKTIIKIEKNEQPVSDPVTSRRKRAR